MTTDKHEVFLRMKAIELLAYWEGRLITNHLMSWFGLSRQQASADIKRYNTLYNPDALIHDLSVKGYVSQASFQPVLTTAHINEYLNILSGLVSEPHAIIAMPQPNLSVVQQRYQSAITLTEAKDTLKYPLVLQNSDIEKLSS